MVELYRNEKWNERYNRSDTIYYALRYFMNKYDAIVYINRTESTVKVYIDTRYMDTQDTQRKVGFVNDFAEFIELCDLKGIRVFAESTDSNKYIADLLFKRINLLKELQDNG